MEESATVQCPYCGQNCELSLDTSMADQLFTTDCEVCCRPFTVSVDCEDGEIVSFSVSGE